MNRLRTLFHPIFVFVGVQIAWIALMGVWIYWYIKNHRDLTELAEKIRPESFPTDFDWVILLEGCILMLFILAGVYVIFVYWNKQNRLNKLQSNFVSSVSHELKSPLASIQLYLETLKYQEVSEEETRDFVDIMLSDTERLSYLIDNILESSKSGSSLQPQFQPVDIGSFLREVVEGFDQQFKEKKCSVILNLDSDPVLNVDKRGLRMVFNNLIGNALRYSNAGSTLRINLKRDKKFYRIEFADKGIGLQKKDMKKIFRKFYRVQNRETQNIEGAGLGLFISNEIVKSHKGHMKVASEGRGTGCVFTVALPLKLGVSQSTAPVSEKALT